MKFFLKVLGVSLAFLAFSSQAALAHDQLVDNYPADGEVFAEAPSEIRLSFNNKLLDIGEGATVINLTDSAGNLVETQAPEIQGMDAVLPLGDLTDGAYRAVWRVVSSDGHPISGSFAFAIGENGEAALQALPPLSESGETGEGEETGEVNTTIVAIVTSVAAALVLITAVVLFVRKKNSPTGEN